MVLSIAGQTSEPLYTKESRESRIIIQFCIHIKVPWSPCTFSIMHSDSFSQNHSGEIDPPIRLFFILFILKRPFWTNVATKK